MKKTYEKPRLVAKVQSMASGSVCGQYTKSYCGPVNFAHK